MKWIRRVIAIWYFVHWNDTEKDEEKKGGDTVNAVKASNGGDNEESVKTKEVGAANGVCFVVQFDGNMMKISSHNINHCELHKQNNTE